MFSGGAAADEPRDRAIELLREAIQCTQSLPEDLFEDMSGLLFKIAKAYSKAGDSTTAGRLLDDAWNASLTVEADVEAGRVGQLAIVELQAELGRADIAISAVKQLPSPFERAAYLGVIARVQGERGETTAAIRTVDLIPLQESFMRNTAHVELAEAISEGRKYAEAIRVLEMMGKGPDSSEEEEIAASKQMATGLVRVAQIQAKAGDLNEAIRTASTITGESHRDVALRFILCAAADQMEVATARETFNTIKNQTQKDMGAPCLVASLCLRKQLDEAASIVKDISQASVKAIGLLEIAIGYAASGDVKRTQESLEQSLALAPLEGRTKENALKQIVEAFVKSGHYDHGRAFVQRLSEPGDRSASFEVIALAQWKQGSKKIAQQALLDSQKAADDMAEPYFRSIRLRELAVAMAGIDAKEESFAIMKSALAAARVFENGTGVDALDVLNLTDIATSQVKIGDIESVDSTLEAAYTAARKIQDRTQSADLLAGVIEAQAHFGNSTRAIEIAHEEKSPDLRVGMLVAAANGLLAR